MNLFGTAYMFISCYFRLHLTIDDVLPDVVETPTPLITYMVNRGYTPEENILCQNTHKTNTYQDLQDASEILGSYNALSI